MLNWPPISSAASYRSTAWPRSASVVAAARPAGPAPTTAKRLRCTAGWISSTVSCPARGLTRQLASWFLKVWSRQAWLQAMQVLMSSARPAAALATKAGSASSGRARLTRSAQPSTSTCSPTSGVLMRLLVTSGVVMPAARSSSRIAFVMPAKAARGTLVAMVGTRASCQPMPVLRIVVPAFTTALASCTTSGQLLPSGIRSCIDRR
jgi:hypothetical protein